MLYYAIEQWCGAAVWGKENMPMKRKKSREKPDFVPLSPGEPHWGKYVSYLRVSTQKQGVSGLGIEAQRAAIERHLNGGRHQVIEEFVEHESGRRTSRPQLAAALAACRKHKARLVVSKLDRLARNTRFLLSLIDSKVDVEFCDFVVPEGASGRLILSIMASVAEFESRVTGERTKIALQAARKRGKQIGGHNAQSDRNAKAAAERDAKLRLVIERIQREQPDISANALAIRLNDLRIPTAVTGARWHAASAQRLMKRLEAAS
jgi:DNA invertase Pin-like site-specific DNA recombinase